MKLAVFMLAMLVASVAKADCAPNDFECGLSVVELGQAPSAAPRLKSQLVEHDTKTPKVIGAVAGIAGGLSLMAAWTLYVARSNFRLEPRYTVTPDDVGHWESLGSWSLWMGIGGAAGLLTAEALLLPESDGVPFLAMLGGVAGLATAAVGVGFAVGSSTCAPIALRPGAEVPISCLSGTSDALFGPLLIATSLPLLGLPLTYLLRSAFAGTPEPLSLGPGSIQWRQRF